MVRKKTTPTIDEEIKTILSDLFAQLEIEAKIEVGKEESKDDNYKVNIETAETGLLIGRHGETLNSLQLLLGVILYKKLGKWIRVILDIGDYRKGREESIKEMVNRIVAEVISTKQPVILPYLTPFERRIVHLMLTDNKEVDCQSYGIGKERRITISPKTTDLPAGEAETN
jgi:spoIIIJ-associated protein